MSLDDRVGGTPDGRHPPATPRSGLLVVTRCTAGLDERFERPQFVLWGVDPLERVERPPPVASARCRVAAVDRDSLEEPLTPTEPVVRLEGREDVTRETSTVLGAVEFPPSECRSPLFDPDRPDTRPVVYRLVSGERLVEPPRSYASRRRATAPSPR